MSNPPLVQRRASPLGRVEVELVVLGVLFAFWRLARCRSIEARYSLVTSPVMYTPSKQEVSNCVSFGLTARTAALSASRS